MTSFACLFLFGFISPMFNTSVKMQLHLCAKEKNEQKENYNEYEDYVDDYYGNDYKNNTKHDSGATRFKRIPLHKITLESEIPEEPQEKHDKPNDSHYEKELKKINDEVENHKKSREELYEKLRQERLGKNPELNSCHDTLKEIKEEMDPIENKIRETNEKIKGPLEKEKKLKRILLFYTLQVLNVKKIQKIFYQIIGV